MAQKNDSIITEPTTNATPFLTSDTAYDAYDESRKWYRTYFEPLDEYERIARNKPSPRIDPSLPRITDGTTASIIQEDPKRLIQQSPTGIIACKDYPEYAKIADLVLAEKLIPMYNRNGNMLQKAWNMSGKSLTYGVATSYTFETVTNGIIHTDFVIPYIKDVYGEKGKVFLPDCNIRFMRSWYQKRDLQAIINKEKVLMSKSKDYTPSWDPKLLARFIEAGASSKNAEQMTAAEKEKGGDSGGYEVIHAFQRGVKAEFYSFAPNFEGGKPLRVKVNKDPRGMVPLDDLYCNIDLSNPLGRGSVELSGGVQNLMDQQLQMFQFMNTMEQGPPLQVWGSVNKGSLKFRPNAIWDMGSNPNNKVEPYSASTAFTNNFTANAQYLQSKIYNLNNSQDHSIPADSNSVGQSKTQAGVKSADARLGISDNYLRKQFEAWFSCQSETSVNIHFAEMTAKDTMKLKGEDLKEIMRSEAKKYVDNKGVLTIPYEKINDIAFKFNVDTSSSEVKEDSENVDKLIQTLEVMMKVPNPEVQQAIPKIVKLIVDQIGAEGAEDIFPSNTDQNGQPVPQQPQGPDPQQMQQMVMQMVDQAMQAKEQNKPLHETLAIKFTDLPDDAKAQVLQSIGVQSQGPFPQAVVNDQKQQQLDQSATKQALDIQNTAHQHTMDMHNATMTAIAPPEQAQSPAEGSPADNKADPAGADSPMSEEEQQIAHALLQRGFNEQDVEQAIIMQRNGIDSRQIMQTLGAKYATK